MYMALVALTEYAYIDLVSRNAFYFYIELVPMIHVKIQD